MPDSDLNGGSPDGGTEEGMIRDASKGGEVAIVILAIVAGLAILLASSVLALGQEHIGVAVLAGAIAFIVISRMERRGRLTRPNLGALLLSPRTMRLLEIGFFIVVLVTSLIVLSHNSRPDEYFLILPIAAGLLGAQVLGGGGKNVKRVLAQCALLALALWAGLVFNYATLWGSDVFFHHEFARYISEVGYVPDAAEYYALQYNDSPLYHILIASFMLLLDTGSILTVFLSTSLPITLALPLVYVITKHLTRSSHVSMLATLVYGISDMLMVYSVTLITPGSMTLVLILAVLAIAFSDSQSWRGMFLIVVMMGAALLSHQVTIAVAAVIFAGFFLVDMRFDLPRWFRTLRGTPAAPREGDIEGISWRAMSPWVYALMAVGVLGIWMASGSRFEGESFLIIMLKDVLNAFMSLKLGNPFKSYSLGGSLSNTLFQLGYTVFLAFAVLGMLHLLRGRGKEKKVISLAAVTVLLVLVIYGAPLTPLGGMLITYRWMTFLYVFLVVGVAWALALLPGIPRRRWGRKAIVPAACLLLTFLMITTPFISADNPLFESDRVVRSAFNADEVVSIGMAEMYQGGAIVSDPAFSERILAYYYAGGPTGSYNVEEDFSLTSVHDLPLYHIRTALETESFIIGEKQEFGLKHSTILGSGFIHCLHAGASHSLIYSSGGTVMLR